ncbi:MAG: hypothetical protein IPM99_00205 [Rubrivivax sp.]|jgi:hypothetical protein|nr:hypothetical protein [Rubrivivax sp.]
MTQTLQAFRRLAGGLVTGVARVLLLALGALAALAAMAMGLLLAGGLVAWALLRGRKPVVRQAFVWPGRGERVPAQDSAEVVDIEAREVPDAPPRPLPRA